MLNGFHRLKILYQVVSLIVIFSSVILYPGDCKRKFLKNVHGSYGNHKNRFFLLGLCYE